MSKQEYENSVEWIQQTLAADPTNVNARILLAKLFLQSERCEDAQDIIQGIVQDKSKSLTNEQQKELDLLGRMVGMGERSPAIQIARDIVGQEITRAEKVKKMNCCAAAAFSMKEYEDADFLLGEALKIDETSDLTRRNMAILLLANGKKEEARLMVNAMDQADFVLLYLLQERENG